MAQLRLKEILKERNLSYRQAERLTGVSDSTLSDIANGKSDPRLSVLEQIAEGLQIHITDLFESKYK